MALKDRLSDDLKEAMRAGEAVRRETLRSILAAVRNTELARVNVKDESASRQELVDSDVLDVLQKQAKQRRESIEEYKKAARQDLVDRETAELAIISAYLPAQMGRDEIVAEVRKAMEETGAAGPGDKSKLMPVVMGRLKGRADGRAINEVVTELLGGK
ncbi:MAG: GatB/YqeY domain-containing protein [Chloroflexi bacterium]|nr:GatB/YqeY domain-containing protein [Chloroflexota bacterium]